MVLKKADSTPNVSRSTEKTGAMQLVVQEELETIFGRPVDLVAEKAVERSENHIKRRHILATKVVIHAAG